MHPVVFQIGKVVIHSYGLMLALSFFLGIVLASWRAKRNGLDPNVISDVGLWVILSAIIGSRLYYVILNFDEFQHNLLSIFWPVQEDSCGIGGLVMYGGLIGVIVAALLYFKLKKIPFLPYADAAAPAFAFGIFLTRIGCFLNGCCFGEATTSSIGVCFPNISPAGYFQAAQNATKLYPSQLFLSAGGLIIGVILLIVGRKVIFPGFLFYLSIILYAILRFLVDFSRHFKDHEKFASLSHNQIVCIFLFIIFAGLMVKNFLLKDDLVQESNPTSSE